MKQTILLFILTASTSVAFAQDRKDGATYDKAPKNTFYEKIKKDNSDFFKKKEEPQYRLTLDYSKMDVPKSLSEFTIVSSEKPVSQGNTGTCWAYSTTSFYESEAIRKGHPGVTISEMYTVYWEYVDKAKEYVRTRGNSAFGEGSETNAVQRVMKEHGAVPLAAYTGLKDGQPFQDHTKMFKEMESYLKSVKARNAWNTDEVVATIRDIMDHYIGTPPSTFTYRGRSMSPHQYLSDVADINPSDYVTFMSLRSEPYWTNAEYKVEDNWGHSKDYYNVPLNDFTRLIKNALSKGYSISIGGDVSESGIDIKRGIMMIPSYDIPSSYIDENARLLRFLNGATTDDHAMHIVGWAQRDNGVWYLVKDSGSGGHVNDTHNGYWYMHEDYVKLKMMTATVNKAAVKDVLQKLATK
ncbi:MAG: C1 family peptidase [Chitinophagaceae bacterium]